MSSEPTAPPDPYRSLPPRSPGTVPPGTPLQPAGEVRARQTTAIAAMYAGYAMFMALRTVPAVAGVSIRNDPTLGIDLEDWGKVIAMGAGGTVCGKLLCGWAADRFGGRLTFAAGLLAASLSIGGFALSASLPMFQAAFFMTLLAKSAGWPAIARLMINWIPPGRYGQTWGVLSTSSRVGTMTATLVLGGLLAWISWRSMLWITSSAGLVVVVVFALLLREAPPGRPTADEENPRSPHSSISSHHPLTGLTLAQACLQFAASFRFWLIVGSMMGLTILWDFLLMAPMFLQDTLSLTDTAASMAVTAIPLGSMVSVLVGGFVFDRNSRDRMAVAMGGLLLMATCCLAALQAMSAWHLTSTAATMVALGLLFLFGFCLSPCYYIPMSVFSIEFGGPHAGFLNGLLDAIAFVATAGFYYYGGGVAERSWTDFLTLLVVVAVWSLLLTVGFLCAEPRKARHSHPG